MIRASQPAIQSCTRSADVKGTLKLSWTIGADGRVKDVRIMNAEFQGSQVGTCITRVVQGLRFPEPPQADTPVNNYPFVVE